MNNQYPSSSSSSTPPSSRPENKSVASAVAQDMRAKAGEATSKVIDAAQQAGTQAKQTASFARVRRQSKGKRLFKSAGHVW